MVPASGDAAQLRLLAEIEALAASDEDVAQMWILGSARQPDLLDRWSDIDVGLVLTGSVELASLFPPGSVIWALDRNADGVRATCRVVLVDGRRVDLVVAVAEEFERARGRLVHAGGRRRPAATVGLVVPDPLDAAVNEARFVAAQAVVKYGRGDRLIGSHLSLELAQLCLVQAMLLRDRDEGTTSHRFGTARDELAARTWSILQSADTGPFTRVQQLAEYFDRLHSDLDADYVPDWSGLLALIE